LVYLPIMVVIRDECSFNQGNRHRIAHDLGGAAIIEDNLDGVVLK
jgi:hypothetical protein